MWVHTGMGMGISRSCGYGNPHRLVQEVRVKVVPHHYCHPQQWAGNVTWWWWQQECDCWHLVHPVSECSQWWGTDAGAPFPSSLVDTHNPPYEQVLIMGVGTSIVTVVIGPWSWFSSLLKTASTCSPPHKQVLVGMGQVLVVPCQF